MKIEWKNKLEKYVSFVYYQLWNGSHIQRIKSKFHFKKIINENYQFYEGLCVPTSSLTLIGCIVALGSFTFHNTIWRGSMQSNSFNFYEMDFQMHHSTPTTSKKRFKNGKSASLFKICRKLKNEKKKNTFHSTTVKQWYN